MRSAIIGVVLVVLTVLVAYLNLPREDYTVKLVMSSAEGLAVGGRVWVNGFDAGWIQNVEARDGKAVITAGVAPDYAPLHAGTKVRVQWYAALGERILVLYPGPSSNAAIPNGGLLQADSEQVEVDQVLAALDQPTRQKLNGLIEGVHNTTGGREQDFQNLTRSAGPAVQAAGAVFDALGRDAPAIHSLVDQLQRMLQVAAVQQNDVSGTITHLTNFTCQVATAQTQVADTLRQAPPTLREVNATLKDVPPAVDSANKLLHDLRDATRQLPGVANDLAPLMHDLRPAIRDLRPTLRYLYDFLDYGRSARLLDQTHVALPKARDFVKGYQPAISFLRPYTPELMGWIQNWGKNFGSYDSQGHLWNALLGQASPQAVEDSPVTIPPVQQVGRPKPGAVVGQPWNDPNTTDASGGDVN
jgi:phospholipid/cholesterol/gamma-HCH transport system substrate-binding protein